MHGAAGLEAQLEAMARVEKALWVWRKLCVRTPVLKQATNATHPVAQESEEEEQQRSPAFRADEALGVAVEALTRLQVARMARLVWVLAGHGVVDLERLLEAHKGNVRARLSDLPQEKRRTSKHLEP
jgi:hypothetical protein